MNSMIKKFGLILAVLLPITFLLLMNGIYQLDTLLNISQDSDQVISVFGVIVRCIDIVLVIIVAYKLQLFGKMYIRPNNIWKSLRVGWFILIIGVFRLVADIIIIETETDSSILWSRLIVFLALIISVGVLEELLMRGVVLSILKTYFSSDSNVLRVVIIQGVIFGAIHIANWVSGSVSLSYCVFQVLSSIGIGIYMGAVYEKSQSMIGVILLHTILNGGGMIKYIYGYDFELDNGSIDPTGKTTLQYMVMGLLMCLFFTLYAKRIVKKIK